MTAPSKATAGWFVCGLTGGAGMCLLWSGGGGALLLLVAAVLGAISLLEGHPVNAPAAVMGFLAGIDFFVVSLLIRPPCQFPIGRFKRLPGGNFEAVCTPQQGLEWLAAGALVGTALVAGLLWLLTREKKKRSDPPAAERTTSASVQSACAATALLACALVVAPVLSANSWSPSALVRMGNADPLQRYALEQQSDFKLFAPESHYDGVYFYAVANDPLARGLPHKLIDLASHRYAHPLYGWLGWLFSAGRGPVVPGALLMISIAAMAVAAVGTSRLAEHLGMSPWWGLLPSLTPGLLASVSWDTSEPLAAAVVTWALLYWLRGRTAIGGVLLVAVCMTRQPFSVIPVGLAAWELIRMRKVHTRADLFKRLAILAAGPLTMVAWQIYLKTRFEEWPFETADLVLTLPFEGWAEGLQAAAYMGGTPAAQIGLLSLPMLATHLLAALIVTSRALLMRNPIAPVFLALILIWFSFDFTAIVFPKDLLRFTAIPWLLAPFVFARKDRYGFD